jgi:hypothetical protein
MKTARTVIGIISMVLFVIITFQSCAAGIGNALADNGGTSGSSGMFLSLCMLVAGIVGVAARKSKGGAITAGCFYAVGGIVGISNVGIFADLIIWSVLSFIFAVVFIASGIMQKGKLE